MGTRTARWGSRSVLVVVLAVGLVLPALAAASECDSPDAAWLFCEDFEQGGLGWSAWFAQSPFTECNGCSNGTNDPARLLLSDDPADVHGGGWALRMPGEAAANYKGASLTYRSCEGEKRAGCALVGYERLYYRAWVRLAPEHRYVHHFMSIGGTRPDAYWEGDGNAGCRPNGYRHAGSTVDFSFSDTRQEHELFFYTYSPDMGCDSGGYCSGSYAQDICDGCATKDMPCSNGPECCWGNHFSSDPKPVLARGEWVCMEMMMQLNTPGEADGEMAFWVNDVLGHRETGMHWRDVAELALNKVWVQHYIADGDTDQANVIAWDDVIASTERIGCGPPPSPVSEGDDQPDTGSPDTRAVDVPSSGADAPIGADPVGGADLAGGADLVGANQENRGEDGCGCRVQARATRGGEVIGWLGALLLVCVAVRRRRSQRGSGAAQVRRVCSNGA